MSVITWDELSDRTYEAGVERGVLYPLDGPGIPWNGLTEVKEDTQREIKSYYLDGVKFLDHFVPGAFQGSIDAFTYPEELDEIIGISEFAPGVRVHDQRAGMFHLSYRTGVGDPIEGLDLGYKLHLIYNLTANPGGNTFSSLGDKVDPNTFSWTISGIQTTMLGIRPANHLSFDSRTTDSEIMTMVEESLYGTSETDPEMPDLVTLLSTIEEMVA